ncbi:hypothetical protein [Streptomyces mangrovisoli]|uniref:hypothetical protein n=1 Tax=Streptomyces mangrovisoli TaxID=1428628 RepID=UPI000B2D9942|nr:hypothetical protein [Streptomyces mangrovisoli]
MTARSDDETLFRTPRTGWAKAHDPRAEQVRTCVSAFGDEHSPAAERKGGDGNIVRGED